MASCGLKGTTMQYLQHVLQSPVSLHVHPRRMSSVSSTNNDTSKLRTPIQLPFLFLRMFLPRAPAHPHLAVLFKAVGPVTLSHTTLDFPGCPSFLEIMITCTLSTINVSLNFTVSSPCIYSLCSLEYNGKPSRCSSAFSASSLCLLPQTGL